MINLEWILISILAMSRATGAPELSQRLDDTGKPIDLPRLADDGGQSGHFYGNVSEQFTSARVVSGNHGPGRFYQRVK